MKPRILLVIDSKGWALDNIAKQIKKNLSEFYEIDIIPSSLFDDNVVKILILSKKYDLVHFLWRGIISWIYSENAKHYINKLGMNYEEFIEEYVDKNNITTSVCDHLFLDEKDFELTKFVTDKVKNYVVMSKKLDEIYNSLDGIKKPLMVINDGVSLKKFKPEKLDRFENVENKEIVFGWAGNSKFTDSKNDEDLKGLRKIIIPALQELKEEGYNITENFADRNERLIPYEQMPNYYNKIDVYICASKTEGTPEPVLEAMACGVPIISTNVGIVPEAFGEKQKGFILEQRTKEELKNKIKELLNNKKLFEELSFENLEQIKSWDWKQITLKYKKFFDTNLKMEIK